jgi:hypothetical protein
VIGAYTAGVLAGTHSKRLLLSGIYAGRAVLFALFLIVPTTPAVVLLFGAGMGLLWLSTVPPTSGLVAVMFGTRHVGGVVYEATGAYDLMWWLSIALALAAATVHLPISERRAPERAPSTA